MTIFENFKKIGGKRLILNWLKNGVLHSVVLQLLITGFSRKSLEIVRYVVNLKINKKLSVKYNYVLENFDAIYEKCKLESVESNYIWFCWMQGIEQAPELVKICYESVKRSFKERNVVLLTEDNIHEYVDMPSYIMEKFHDGYITRTHFSDLLRIALLATHGGTWVDATVYCKKVPSYMLDSNFFVFQNLKPGADGSILNCSSWFMTAKSNNHLILAIRELLWAYWKKENRLIDYFLLHHFMEIVSRRYPKEWSRIPKYPNSLPHILLLSFFNEYNTEEFSKIIENSPVHKLSYKFTEEQLLMKNTNYSHFMELENNIM